MHDEAKRLGSNGSSAFESGWYQSIGVYNSKLSNYVLSSKIGVGTQY